MLRFLRTTFQGLNPRSACAAGLVALVLPSLASAQSSPRITREIDDSAVVVLKGNTHPLANKRFDRGPVDDSLSGKMLLVLKRSPEQETALRELVREQTVADSPNFHKWLKPAEFGEQFGVADSDIQTVSQYLSDHGFTVGRVYKNRMAIEVSGTAGQLRDTFHTEIHTYSINGHEFYANSKDPSIPAALAPVVSGFASLNNIKTSSAQEASAASVPAKFDSKLHKFAPDYTGTAGATTFYYVAPSDIQKIYNIPVSSSTLGAGGSGVTVGVIGDSQINVNLVTRYQTVSGGTSIPPVVIVDGNDPAITADANIAYAQLELISAAAPSASLSYYVSATTDYDTGLDFAIIRAVEDNAVSVLAIGYQTCEATLGDGLNVFVGQAWLQAAAQGITVVAATGDSGSAACDAPGGSFTTKGLAVNGYASSPYDTAVGGTDFYYSPGTGATYWSTTDSATYESAKGYIQEQAWNDSYQHTDSNSGTAMVNAGGGGFSTVGSVAYDLSSHGPYASPSWQTGFVPTGTTARAIPDVSFFAGNNYNSAEYAICALPTDCEVAGTTLTGVTLTGGTAAAAGVFAGIMAEVVQKYGPQGNANPALYGMFNANNSSSATNTTAIFHDIINGTNSVSCSSGTAGGCNSSYLETVGPPVVYSYTAGTGYDEATGLGSVNASNLITSWTVPSSKPSTTSLTITNAASGAILSSSVHGTPLNLTANVTSTSTGTPTGNVVFETGSILPSYGAIAAATLNSSAVAVAPYNFFLPGGSYNMSARYAGDGSFNPSDSLTNASTVSQAFTVTPEPSHTFIYSSSPVTGTSQVFGSPVKLTVEPFSLTKNNVSTPTGTLSIFNSGASYPFLLMPLNSEGTATFSSILLAGSSSYNLVFDYSGDPSYQPSNSPSNAYSVTVTQATPTITLAASATSASTNVPITLTATLQATAGTPAASTGVAPTGSVTFSNSTTAVTLNSGFNAAGLAISTATTQLTASQLTAGGTTITASYGSDSNYVAVNTSASYKSTTASGTATTLTLSPATTTVNENGTLTLTAQANAGNTGVPGTVQLYANGVLLTGDTFTLSNSGAGTYTVPLVGGYLPFSSGNVVITAVFTPSSNTYTSSSATSNVTVTDDRTTADFGIGTDVASQVISPSSSIVYFQVQLTSIANFAGSNTPIGLTCTVPGSSNLRCYLASSSITLNTSGIGSVTMAVEGYPTVSNGALAPPAPAEHWWLLGGGTTLACIFLIGIPARRKGWQGMLVIMLCAVMVSAAVSGCGSNNAATLAGGSTGQSGLGGTNGTGSAQTTTGLATNDVAPGTYKILVTGTATTNTTLVHNTQVTVLVTTTPTIANGTYSLTNLSSSALMTDPNASTTAGTQVQLYTADGTSDQKFVFTYQSANGYYTIVSVASGLYVTDPNGTYTDGPVTPATQQAATNDNSQLWTFQEVQGGYEIINAASGGVLDDDGFGTGNGTPVIVYDQKDASQGVNQTWYIH